MNPTMRQQYFWLIFMVFLLKKMCGTEGLQPYAGNSKPTDNQFPRRNLALPYNPPPQERPPQWHGEIQQGSFQVGQQGRGEWHHSPPNSHQASFQAGHQNTSAIGYRNRQNLFNPYHNQEKCRIWIPTEVVDKYSEALKIQLDQQNKLWLIETCCNGYIPMKWRGSLYCQPDCENCRNGRCVAPNKCQCFDGFVKNDNGDCVFVCPIDCLNGRCYLDGTCKCDPGYKLDETHKYCQPICSSGCGLNVRHNCTEPEVCGCSKGYRLTDEGCQPICKPDCGIGGTCREANVCQCEKGFTLKNGVCQADCYQKCDNGICYSRNRCICNPGYTYHERSTLCVLI